MKRKDYGLNITPEFRFNRLTSIDEKEFHEEPPKGYFWLSQFAGARGEVVSDSEFKTETSPYGDAVFILDPISVGLCDKKGNGFIGHEKIKDDNGAGLRIWLTEYAPDWLKAQFKEFLHIDPKL